MSILSEIIDGLQSGTRLTSVQEEYGRLATDYEERWEKFLAISREWVLERFPKNLPEGAKVVDLGCGTGAFIQKLCQRFPDLDMIGVDGSFEMLDQARKKSSTVRFSQADFNKIDLGTGGDRYDVVLSMNVLHHLDDPEGHLAQIKSITKEGGTVFVCDYAAETPIMKLAEMYWKTLKSSHNKSFSSPELLQILKQTGFKIKESKILRPNAFWSIQIYHLKA